MAFEQWGDGVLRYQGRLCVLKVDELQESIIEKALSSRYSIHPGSTKIYSDLREVHWWDSMKKRYPYLFESREGPDLSTNPFLVCIYKLAYVLHLFVGVWTECCMLHP
ncbi:hypothetical protein MTR67_022459 [Solanum verrucosum]|uniref:Integrase zinc-binding domain-containing protein n=1 Tax=Solanum verrucosum TaxID=315347 RepID=A0AAF0R033_SOLVR|nr:hypothetical protein MTR67_022459 [Solanum verrucosum]